ncbi:Rab1d [Monocercomonoides exilis]|uniref:Rab1d n=1 Tax=Monocercomonoides exilis TaxID=2049356 RepID=UPI00355A73DA|nr:Rab1d [Monocercomonoides exilis]|eukprot:MONOS_14252.1-p1 / transcript=MONOS_14252.1 / gene=MONOS_14252 / organism=Monocercomonoides_exilis_PA203 / gene_product=Rab1d / transcript_product=Rab1d / location=Mono_scaffold00963:19912-21016(+) / protein_length=203 / sequence_SO=supercontig / SO=protein_coding / is_pseudo=false
MDYDYIFKILLIGDSGVGKSSVLLRFVDDVFSDSYVASIGVDFRVRTVKVGDKIVKLHLWDTAGQERFRSIITQFYRGSRGIFVMYDVTNRDSFNSVQMWLKDIENFTTEDPVRLLIGNKADLASRRVIPFQLGKQLAETVGMPFIETSAKSSQNVDAAFQIMVDCLLGRFEDVSHNEIDDKPLPPVPVDPTVKRKLSCPCS